MDRHTVDRDLDRLEPDLIERTRQSMAGRVRALPTDMALDAAGHALYARVTALPDFGMSRAETELLRTHAGAIISRAGNPSEIVDLRCGNGTQARPLLNRAKRYVAIEKCRTVLDDAIGGLAAAFPRLVVHGVIGDGTTGLGPPNLTYPRLLLLLDGVLGRSAPTEARLELSRIRSAMAPDDRLLVGMDLAKEPYRLAAAYDDAGGVYGAFVKNALRRANREIGTDFQLSEWQPVVEVRPDQSCVEVRLESRREQWVNGGRVEEGWQFLPGESIVAERAQKPTEGQFAALALSANFRVVESWSDPAQNFAMFLLASEVGSYVA